MYLLTTLCQVHHQWLLGQSTVYHCSRGIEILKADANQAGIRRELHRAQSPWQGDRSPDGKDVSTQLFKTRSLESADFGLITQEVVFPFITTCLLLGVSIVKPEQYNQCQIIPLPIKTSCNEQPNDDGISVYDITDAPTVRYAFTLMTDPSKHNPPAETIIDARK